METHNYDIDLITKYLTKEATPDEVSRLLQWADANEQNRRTLDEFRQSFDFATQHADTSISNINVDDEWAKISQHLGFEAKVVTMNTENKVSAYRVWLRIAAVIAVPLLVGIYFMYIRYAQPDMVTIAAQTTNMQTMLPDGSRVALNSGASINFAEGLEGAQRRLSLQGEAYFEVAHDKQKPFVIETPTLQITVVGTAFYVKTSDIDKNTEVIVDEGIVEVCSTKDTTQKIRLTAGERTVVSADAKNVDKQANTEKNYISWQTKKMVFDNATLAEIVAKINQVYATNIKIADAVLENCRMTVTFDNQTPQTMLNIISATLGVIITTTDNVITISGAGC